VDLIFMDGPVFFATLLLGGAFWWFWFRYGMEDRRTKIPFEESSPNPEWDRLELSKFQADGVQLDDERYGSRSGYQENDDD
jgi:hypothetical protein